MHVIITCKMKKHLFINLKAQTMKKLFALTVVFMSIGLASNAQCDGTTKWTCNKQTFIDASGNTVMEKDEMATVTSSDKAVTIKPEGNDDFMEGNVSDYKCNWSEPGKNGKPVFKSEVTDNSGKIRHATITIEAKDGKITILLEAEEESNKILLTVEKYEAVK